MTIPFNHRRDIHKLIFDISEHQRQDDIDQFWRMVSAWELFSPAKVTGQAVSPTQDDPRGGRRILTGKDTRVALTLSVDVNGGKACAFLLDKTDPRLGREFVGMSALEALLAVQSMDDAYGIAIVNRDDYWMGATRDDIAGIIRKYFRQ